MRIAVVSPIDAAAIELLAARHDLVSAVGLSGTELERAVTDREVLIVRSGVTISAGLLRQAPDTRLVVRAGSGLDSLDVEYMEEAGIRVVSPRDRAPGPSPT